MKKNWIPGMRNADNETNHASDDLELRDFYRRCEEAWKELFDAAKAKEELQFAMALTPEMRGMQDAGWSTAEEARLAVDQYLELLEELDLKPIKCRIALSLYSHLSEASGFYEVSKNMMRPASGDEYHIMPFKHLVKNHRDAGAAISPNSNKVMKDLLGHADELGFDQIKTVILEAFEPDLRNGYAHADYVLCSEGIRLRKRNGGRPSLVTFAQFNLKLNRALALYYSLHDCIDQAVKIYSTHKQIVGRMNKNALAMPAIIKFDDENGEFSITSGLGL